MKLTEGYTMQTYDAIVRRYAWFERRRMELVRLENKEHSNLYRLQVHGNPEGYYYPEAAAEEMQRKISAWNRERGELVMMQHLLEGIILESYGWMAPEEMLEDGENILESEDEAAGAF